MKKIISFAISLISFIVIIISEIFAIDLKSVKVGDELNFGRYDDDGEIRELDWYVIDIYDNKMLLLSKYIIDCKPYSDVKKYFKDSLLSHFSEEEKMILVPTENNIRIDNVEEKRLSGFVLDDMFVLNEDDIKKYFYDENGEVKDKRVIGLGTKKAYEHGLNKIYIDGERKKYTSPYWVGSKGYEMGFFKAISYNGKIIEDGYYKSRFDVGIRPSIVIKKG